MDSLREVLDRLVAAGYDVDFYARAGGIGCPDCGETIDPAGLVIDEVWRLEGESDPDEEVIVYALSSGPCGRRGTYTTGYGPNASSDDVAVSLALRGRPDHP